MATTRLMPLHIGKGRSVGTAISAIIDYVENPDKTDKGQLVTSYGCNAQIADKEFLYAKKCYIQKTGKVRGADDVIAYHLRQSLVPGEITPEEANRLGRELAMRFTKGKNAFLVGEISVIRPLFCGISGRGESWHSRGQRFDPAYLHQKRS